MRCWCRIAVLVLLASCAPSRYVKPLAKEQSAVSLSFGGPMIRFAGASIPIPFTTLGYGYGISDRLTAYGHLHSTSLLFGNAQADLGLTYTLLKSDTWGLSASPALQLASSLRQKSTFRLWPSIDLNAYDHIFNKHDYLYGGLTTWVEVAKQKAHDIPVTRHLLPNLQLGYVWARGKWQHQAELKYLAPGTPNLPGVVNYIGISGNGALGIYYSISRIF